MTRTSLSTAVFLSLATVQVAYAQAPFSCDPGFEERFRNGFIEPEMRNWIADMARRLAKPRAAFFWQHLPRDLYPCADLSCLSDEQIVARVARQCTAEPRATLEKAAQDMTSFVTSTFRAAPVDRPNR